MTEPILTPFLDASGVTLYSGDCIEVMRQLPEASVDAIVTDPPYGLEFMGRDWDGFGTPLGFQTWTEAWAREALRILKPGGHLLAFAGTRTYHRMASGVEDAGFEIRDCIAWMYGSGFPKSLDVSKAIDKAAGAEREVLGIRSYPTQPNGRSGIHGAQAFAPGQMHGTEVSNIITAPATDAARKWSGWGTALKPAFEPVVVARKPLTGTVAQNVLEHGTGAINVDGCRIAGEMSGNWRGATHKAGYDGGWDSTAKPNTEPHTAGRWPANVVLDETAGEMLDEQSGLAAAKPERTAKKGGNAGALGAFAGSTPDAIGTWPADPGGGASRFFYCAKASKKDRNTNGVDNTHPTVKPTDLMRWLIRLVTPPGGIILDPFGGSGSTGVAARMESVRCIMIEREAEYLDIIRQRLDEGPLLSMID